MIDITKKYRTRDGRDVTGLHMRDSEHYPIGGFIGDDGETWTADGQTWSRYEDKNDLIEVTGVDAKLAELIAFRDAAIAKYPDLASVDPIEAEVERIYDEYRGNSIRGAIRVALLRGIEIGKEGA